MSEESQTKKLLDARAEGIKKVHVQDVNSLIKELKAFSKATQALQLQGARLAVELIDFGNKADNQWAQGFVKIGQLYKEVYPGLSILNKQLSDDCNQLTNQVAEDTKNFMNLDARMKLASKQYDEGIQKLALITQNNRKKDPSIMLKSMAELTDAVAAADAKRDGMIRDLNQMEQQRFASWFKVMCGYLGVECEVFKIISTKLTDAKPFWNNLEKTPPPDSQLSAWCNDVGVSPTPAANAATQRQSVAQLSPVNPEPPKEEKPKKEDKKDKDNKDKDKKPKESFISKFSLGTKTTKKDPKADDKKESPSTPPPAPPANPSTASVATGNTLPPLSALNLAPPPALDVPPMPKPPAIRAKAIHDYTPEHPDELALKTGELVEVLQKQEDDWWVGVTTDGRKGLFPSTFVEEIHVTAPTEERNPNLSNTVAENLVLPEGWEITNTADGETYYYNPSTQESQWEPPTR